MTRTGAQGAGSSTYAYDAAGNTTTRDVAGQGTQSLVWDVEGELVEVTGPGAGSFVYTADGDRLVRRQGGAVTVYLPGGQEVTAGPDGAVSAVRYYGLGGRTVASRTDTSAASVRSLVSDAQGTAHLAITTTTGQVTRRYTDPYGNPRGHTTDWVGDRGFLDKPVDASGLSAVGARYYDPTLGRFISVDPVMDLTDPAQWHGYSYANNNPITYTDPTGLKPMAIDGGHGVGKRTTPSNSEAAAKSAPASSSTSRGDTFRAPVSTPCVRMSYGCLNGSSGRPGRAVAGPSRANNLPPVYVVQQGTSPEQVAINAAYAKLFADEAMKNQEPWQQDLYEFTQGLDAVLGPMIPLLMAGAGSMRAAPRTAPRAAAGSAKAQFVLSPTLVGKPTASTTGSGWTRVGRWTSPAEHAAMKETGSIQWNARGVHRVATPASPSTYRNAPKGDIYVECDVPSGVLKPHSEGTSIIYGPQSLQARLPGRAQTGQVPFQNLVESR